MKNQEEYTTLIYTPKGKKSLKVKKVYKAVLQGKEEVLIGDRKEVEAVLAAIDRGAKLIKTKFGVFNPMYFITYKEASAEVEAYIIDIEAGRTPEKLSGYIKEAPALLGK